ncbi:MAG: nitroreductase family protein, partial [Phycisphaerales bacterium]|nr:nitroreductase family protein [Phycisphaerales bacterium]
ESMPEPELRAAVQAAQQAATSAHIQVYSVLRVTRPEHLQKLVELTGGQEKVAQAGTFLVICGDMRRHQLLAQAATEACNENLESFLLCVVDASLFAQNLALAAESLGWGTCFIGGLRNDLKAVGSLFELPQGVYPLFGLCIGRADETPWKRPRLPVEAVLFDDCYPNDAAMISMMRDYDEDMAAYYEKRGASGRRWIG